MIDSGSRAIVNRASGSSSMNLRMARWTIQASWKAITPGPPSRTARRQRASARAASVVCSPSMNMISGGSIEAGSISAVVASIGSTFATSAPSSSASRLSIRAVELSS